MSVKYCCCFSYYIALRKIDELNEKILPSLINFFFIQKLKDSLPDASEKIKEGSLEDLRLFLEEARVVSKDIGKAAIQMVKLFLLAKIK